VVVRAVRATEGPMTPDTEHQSGDERRADAVS
jgi:hypothetical protein